MSTRVNARPPPVCADCSATDPKWASINRGVLICDECCSVHRSLGRHISIVKSIKKGHWSSSQLTMVYLLATNGANNIWEHTLMDPAQNRHGRKKPGRNDPLHPNKSDFIRSKYQYLSFVNKQKDNDTSPLDDVCRELHSSVRTNNVETCLRLLSKGADPNYFHKEKGNCPMHVAAQAGQLAQVELLAVYGADPGARDANGRSPVYYARCEDRLDVSERLVELQYQLTDRLTFYVCGRRPDRRIRNHLIIPVLGDHTDDLSDYATKARKKLQDLPNHLFEELAMDVYDEVDRRENDSVWLSTHDHTSIVSERLTVPHLPVNPELSTTRNQGRQKLARYSAQEFTTLVVDILHDARTRQMGITSSQSLNGHSAGGGLNQGARSMLGGAMDDEPLYDCVASDEDYCSVDTHSVRSLQADVKGDSVIECSAGSAVSTEEFLSVRRALVESQVKIQQLVRVKEDLERHMTNMHSQMESLMIENQTLRVHRGSAILDHVSDASGQSGDLTVQGRPRCQSRPLSMIEMRDTGQSVMPAVWIGGQPAVFLCVHPLLSHAWDRQVHEVLSAICESSESEGQDSVSFKGTVVVGVDDGGQMPGQDDVIRKTEKVTKKIQELLQAAQEGNHESFALCSERIHGAVVDMTSLFPQGLSSHKVREFLDQLMSSADQLRVECTDWPPPPNRSPSPDFRLKTQQVIQFAYDIAKAAKKLVTLFQ